MPRELPGMFWDHERQRYFPLASRQVHPVPTRSLQQAQVDSSQSAATSGAVAIKYRRGRITSYHALSNLRSVFRTVHKDTLIHQIRSSQISLTDKVARSILPLEGLFSAFHTASYAGRVWSFAGDTEGWFYSSVLERDHEEMGSVDPWQRQFHLSSEVSSVGVSGTTCVATSFGPECIILFVPLDSPGEGFHATRVDSRTMHDVWTTDLQRSRLVLGANKQAVLIEDIAVCVPLKRIPTKSDVLALAQHESLVYTGLRNGGIFRLDTRLPGSCIHPLFDSGSQRTSSITGLKYLRDCQLLVSFIDGGISTFDLRFPIHTPLMSFTGHYNSYTVKLPLVTDPSEKFLFAAGQDNMVRLWSLSTGGPALNPEGMGSTDQTLFHRPFAQRVGALQVVEEEEGVCLWAASGKELYKYNLGHHSGIALQGGSHGG